MPFLSISILRGSLSTQMTSFPNSASTTPVTSPTYPVRSHVDRSIPAEANTTYDGFPRRIGPFECPGFAIDCINILIPGAEIDGAIRSQRRRTENDRPD